MGIIELLLILVIVGFVLFLFNRFAPLDGNIKQLINYVVMFILVLLVILFVLKLFGLYNGHLNFT
jgi:hypothetical protein